MSNTILENSKGTFQWYLDSLEILHRYNLDTDDGVILQQSIDAITNILNKLEVKG